MKALLKTVSGYRACEEARDWCQSFRGRSMKRAWEQCPRGDWMLWIAARVGVDRKLLVRAACACARLVLHRVPEGELRPLRAIETAEAWCRGEATTQKVINVAYDARTAYHLVDAAAAYAAYAAAQAADDAYAASVTAAVVSGVVTRTHSKCADAVRTHIPWGSIPWVATYRAKNAHRNGV